MYYPVKQIKKVHNNSNSKNLNNKEVQNLQKQILGLQSVIKQKDQEIKTLQESNIHLTKQYELGKEVIIQSTKNEQQHLQLLEQERAQHAVQIALVEDWMEQNNHLRMENDSLKQQSSSMEKQLQELQKSFNVLQTENVQVNKVRNELSVQLKASKKQLVKINKRIGQSCWTETQKQAFQEMEQSKQAMQKQCQVFMAERENWCKEMNRKQLMWIDLMELRHKQWKADSEAVILIKLESVMENKMEVGQLQSLMQQMIVDEYAPFIQETQLKTLELQYNDLQLQHDTHIKKFQECNDMYNAQLQDRQNTINTLQSQLNAATFRSQQPSS